MKSITFNFRGRLLDTPEFPAGEHVVAWIEFINGAKRALAFTTTGFPDSDGIRQSHAEVFAFGSLQLLDHFAYRIAATLVEVAPVSIASLSVNGGRIDPLCDHRFTGARRAYVKNDRSHFSKSAARQTSSISSVSPSSKNAALAAQLLLEDPELLAKCCGADRRVPVQDVQGAREQRGSRIGSQKIAARPRVPRAPLPGRRTQNMGLK